jgi:hypothetical protein
MEGVLVMPNYFIFYLIYNIVSKYDSIVLNFNI